MINQYNIKVYNYYQVTYGSPPKGSGLPFQPNQTSNYKKQKSNHPPRLYIQQSQNGQSPFNTSISHQPAYGQKPYDSGSRQDSNYSDIHSFRLISRGKGIDQKEYYDITHAANDALGAREDPLSNGIIKRIKKSLGGEWMVLSSIEGLKGYDFSLSIVTGNDYLSFIIENFHFQVFRLRD